MATELDYLHLRAWGAMLGSHPGYINSQVEAARKDGAPQDVIYKTTEQRIATQERDNPNDPERYFHGSEGRVWSRYGAPHEDMPAETVSVMTYYLDNLRRTGKAHG